jgi:hypothetical protein
MRAGDGVIEREKVLFRAKQEAEHIVLVLRVELNHSVISGSFGVFSGIGIHDTAFLNDIWGTISLTIIYYKNTQTPQKNFRPALTTGKRHCLNRDFIKMNNTSKILVIL